MFGRKKNPDPGWYPDEADASLERYWCGDRWTSQTRLPGSKTRGTWEPKQGSNAMWLPDSQDPRFQRYWDGHSWTEEVRLTRRVKRLHKKSERSRDFWQETNANRMDETYGYSHRREWVAIEKEMRDDEDRRHSEKRLRHALDMMRGRRDEQAADVARAVVEHFTENGWTELNSITLGTVRSRGMVSLTAAGTAHGAPVTSDRIQVQLSWPASKDYLHAWEDVKDYVADTALDLCLAQLNPMPLDGLVPAVEPTPSTTITQEPAGETSLLAVAEERLAASLRVAAGPREIRTVILAHTGSGNAIADLRFTDGTSQTVNVTQRPIVDILAGGNQVKIERIRAAVLTRHNDRSSVSPTPAPSQRRVPTAAPRAATAPTPSEQLLIDSRQREWDRHPLTAGQYHEHENSRVSTDWQLWMKWTQPSSRPYKKRIAAEQAAAERDDAFTGAAEAKKERRRSIDEAISATSDALADFVMQWAQDTDQTTLAGFTHLHFNDDGTAYVYPRADDGSHWPPGPRLVPLMHLVDEEVRIELSNSWREAFKAFEALAVDRCQRRLKETREAPIREAEAEAAAAELERINERDAKRAIGDKIADSLSTAIAGRVIHKVILSPAGPRRGVVDLRFTDGTAHIADVTHPVALSMLQSGDNDAIEELRRFIQLRLQLRLIPTPDEDDDYFDYEFIYPSSQDD